MIVEFFEFLFESIFEQQKTTGSSILRKMLKRSIDLHFQKSFKKKSNVSKESNFSISMSHAAWQNGLLDYKSRKNK